MSFGNVPVTFNYDEGINIVTGFNHDTGTRNGVGKSAILADSISLAIYGKTLRGEHINKDEVINEVNKKNCVVSVELSIGNDEYIVTRTIKPNSFQVTVNSVEYKQDSIKQTEAWFHEKIGISHTCFKNIIVLNMNDSVPFLNMDAAHKREVIEDILNMNIYGRLSDIAKDKHLIAKSDLKVAETTLTSKKDAYEYAKNSLSTYKAAQDEFNKQKNITISNINNEINSFSKELNTYKDKEKNIDYVSEIQKKKEGIEKVRGILSKLRSDNDVLNNNIKTNTSALNIIDKKPHCPTCHTPTDNPIILEYISELKNKLLTLKNELLENTKKIKKAESVFNSLNSSLDDLVIEKDDQINIKNNIKNIEGKLTLKNKELESESQKTFSIPSLASEETLNDMKSKYDMSRESVANNATLVEYNQALRKILGEDGVRKFVVSKILPFFINKVNSYLKIMGSELTIVFDSNLDAKIFTRTREERTYGSFSSGEKKRIDISILLSLMDLSKLQNSVDTNILILDEVLDTAMDNEGVESFLGYLKNGFRVLYPNKAVYIITHRNTISDDFYNKIIVLNKKDGFTTINSIVEMQQSSKK